MMMWPVTSLLAHLWHPKRANERQLPTNTVGRRARLDDGSGAFLPVAGACNERPVRVGLSPLDLRSRTVDDLDGPRMAAEGRVGMWRGGVRSTMSVAAPFVWRCLSGSAITPFPHPPGHRRRSPAPGSHRTWRADFPHQRSSAVASQHCKRLQLPVGEAQFRCQQRCPFFDLVEGVPGEAAAGPAAAAQHPAPVTLHDPIYFDETPEISGDAVISIVAA